MYFQRNGIHTRLIWVIKNTKQDMELTKKYIMDKAGFTQEEVDNLETAIVPYNIVTLVDMGKDKELIKTFVECKRAETRKNFQQLLETYGSISAKAKCRSNKSMEWLYK